MGSAIPDAPQLRLGAITFINAILDPLIHFLFKPSDAVRAEHNSLGELTGLLQAGDMLRRVADLRTHFRFREQFHRKHSIGYGASRRPEG